MTDHERAMALLDEIRDTQRQTLDDLTACLAAVEGDYNSELRAMSRARGLVCPHGEPASFRCPRCDELPPCRFP